MGNNKGFENCVEFEVQTNHMHRKSEQSIWQGCTHQYFISTKLQAYHITNTVLAQSQHKQGILITLWYSCKGHICNWPPIDLKTSSLVLSGGSWIPLSMQMLSSNVRSF